MPIPLVIKNGEIAQIQSGDLLIDPVAGIPYSNFVSCKATVAFSKGEIGYLSGFLTVIPLVDKAIADGSIDMTYPLCIATQAIAANGTGVFLFVGGYMAFASGLVTQIIYFLSETTAGAITSSPPTTAGHYIVRVGCGINTAIMFWKFERPILLA